MDFPKEFSSKSFIAVLSIVVGVIIILKPDFLGLLVGLYLIITGLTQVLSK